MALAWLFTLPIAALVGAMAGKLANRGTGGVVIVALIALVLVVVIYAASRRAPVTAKNVNDTHEVKVTRKPEPALSGANA